MIRKITLLFMVCLICGMSCTSVTATTTNNNLEEIEPIPEIFTLHHFLSSQKVKDWMEQTERKVAETDKFLEKKREHHELAVARLKNNGSITYQCDGGQFGNNDKNTGYLNCGKCLRNNTIFWAIYPLNDESFSIHLKHNVNATALIDYWQAEGEQFWNNSKQYLKDTVFEGKTIEPWRSNEYEDWGGNAPKTYAISPQFKDANGNTWEILLTMIYDKEPNRIEEGYYYCNLGFSSLEIWASVMHDKYALPINYDEFSLGPIVYHY